MKNNFIGRQDFRENFWDQYGRMQSDTSVVLNYYGAGGIGKSSLIEQLIGEIDRKKLSYGQIFRDMHALYYNFTNGTDTHKILNQWKYELSKVGVEFPYFETGNFYLSIKQGAQNVSRPTMKSWLERNPFVKTTVGFVGENDTFSSSNINSLTGYSKEFGIEISKEFIDALGELPYIKTAAMLFNAIDNALALKKTDRQLKLHADVRKELNYRTAQRNTIELETFLPILFAQDVLDCIGNRKLIIFLDTYEELIKEGSGGNQLNPNNIRPDDWLFNPTDGLIALIPNVFWVIAGRDKLNRKFIDEGNQYLMTGFEREDADNFLRNAGVEDEAYRNEIINLTGGYPIFLEECVKILHKAVERPPIEVLDKYCRHKVIERLLKNMSVDSGAMLMIQELCILGEWTDKSARKILPHYNPNTYKRIKNLSFILSTRDENGNEVFRFDEMLRQVMLPSIERDEELRRLIEKINLAVRPPIDASTSIAMRSGQRNALSAQNISVTVDWNAEFAVDVIIFMRRADGSIVKKCNDKIFSVELEAMPADVTKIQFVLAIEGDHTFAEVNSIGLRLVDESNRKEILHFGVGNELTVETAVVLGEIYKHKGNWKFKAIGAGFKEGLAAIHQ